MFTERVNHFKVVTEWPELINKRILQIDNQLQEIQFISQVQSLFARGLIKREIRYMEPDGRSRKTEDRMQFEVNLGQPVPEPLPVFTVELKQDYYLFLPGRIGEQQAVLEQSFSFTAREKEPDPTPEHSESLLLNSVVASGEGNDLAKVHLKFPDGLIQPKDFRGVIRFAKQNKPPVANGEIDGIVTYRHFNNLMAEIDLKEPVSLLINAPTPGPEQFLFITGTIHDVNWKPTLVAANWLLELAVNYRWYLCEPKEIFCLTSEKGPSANDRIKTFLLLEENCYELPRIFTYSITKTATNIVVEIENVTHRFKLTKKGLLLTVDLKCEVIYTDEEGTEKYREFQSQIEELVQGPSSIALNTKTLLKTAAEVKAVSYNFAGGELKVNINCRYHLKTYLTRLTGIMTDNDSAESILATTLVGQESFSIPGEDFFPLRYRSLGIEQVKTKLNQLKPICQNGRLDVNGWLEVGISYTDPEQRLREDKFNSFFQESFFWDKLKNSNEVNLEGKLEYDNFSFDGQNIKYKYLISILAEAFQEQIVKIATVKRIPPVSPTHDTMSQSNPANPVGDDNMLDNLLIEGELPLKQGNIREIVESKAYISQFEVRDSLKALFIKGNLTGELKYWDEERYLQREMLDLPFWKFTRKNPVWPSDYSRLVPEVIHYSFFPVKNGLWRKDSIKISFEIELKNEGESR